MQQHEPSGNRRWFSTDATIIQRFWLDFCIRTGLYVLEPWERFASSNIFLI